MSAIPQVSPKAAELLAEYGLHCITCYANQFDTVETGGLIHGMSDEEIEVMINEINEALASEANNMQDTRT